MATTAAVIPNSPTPYSIMYRVASDGAAVFLTKLTGTQLLLDMADGPLRETLARTPTTAWNELNAGAVQGDLIRIYGLVPGSGFGNNTCHAAETRLTWIAGANLGACGLEVSFESFDGFESEGSAAGEMAFEIRRLHSASR